MFGSSFQPLIATQHAVIKLLSTAETIKHCSAVVGSWEEPLNIWLMVAKNGFVGWALNFRVPMLLRFVLRTRDVILCALIFWNIMFCSARDCVTCHHFDRRRKTIMLIGLHYYSMNIMSLSCSSQERAHWHTSTRERGAIKASSINSTLTIAHCKLSRSVLQSIEARDVPFFYPCSLINNTGSIIRLY